MATVNKRIAMQVMLGDGHFKDDPRVLGVWCYKSYRNQGGRNSYSTQYSIHYSTAEGLAFVSSDFVQDPTLLWEHIEGLTSEGKRLLKQAGKLKK